MAVDKKSFIAYCDWQETFEALPDEKAGQLIKHIFRYVNDEDPVCEDVLINAVFANIKQSLKRDLKKYESTLKRKKESGSIGNLKRWHPDLYQKYINKELSLDDCMQSVANRKESQTDGTISHTDGNATVCDSTQSQTVANIADSVNDNVSDSVNDNVLPKGNDKVSKDTVAKAPIFFFKKELVNIGVDPKFADAWVKVRKAKRAVNTKIAFDALKRQFDKSGLPPNDCVKMAVENSWAGFKAEWLEKNKLTTGQKHYQPKNNRKCKDW